MTITATFVKTRKEDSGSDSVMDYYVYEFSNIVDTDGNKYGVKWIKTTKLLERVTFVRGKKYTITLSSDISKSAINMPFPISVFDGKDEYYKHGGLIKQKDAKGNHITLTEVNRHDPGSEMPAIKKLASGKIDEGYLLRKNSKGVYFKITYEYSTDRRGGSDTTSYWLSDTSENVCLIQKSTQEEIDKDIQRFKNSYRQDILKHFVVKPEIVEKKKKK